MADDNTNADESVPLGVGRTLTPADGDGEEIRVSGTPTDIELSDPEDIELAAPAALVQTTFIVTGYDTDSEKTANIACSECGEDIEFIPTGPNRGGVCGCAEPPQRWEMEHLDVSPDGGEQD